MMRLQGKKRYGFDPSPLLPLVKRIIRQKSGAQMDTVNAVKAAAAIRVPVLLFHGTADKLVPFGMSQQIADACPTASLCLVEGAKPRDPFCKGVARFSFLMIHRQQHQVGCCKNCQQ